jgi:hypothetical protein
MQNIPFHLGSDAKPSKASVHPIFIITYSYKYKFFFHVSPLKRRFRQFLFLKMLRKAFLTFVAYPSPFVLSALIIFFTQLDGQIQIQANIDLR